MGVLLAFERRPQPAPTTSPSCIDLESAEVLRHVADVLADAARELPRRSEWRAAFRRIRECVLESIGEVA